MSPKTRVCFSSPSLNPLLTQERNPPPMAITIPPAVITGAKAAGAVALEIAPIAFVAAGIGGLFKMFEKKPTTWEKTVKLAEQAAAVGGVVEIGFKIFDGVYSRMYPKAEAPKAESSESAVTLKLLEMMEKRDAAVDARVKEAVAEALAAYEASKEERAEPEVLQKPTPGKYIGTKKKTGTGG